MKMKPVPLITFGVFFLMKLSAARYLLVEIEDGVKGKIRTRQVISIYHLIFLKTKPFTYSIRFNYIK